MEPLNHSERMPALDIHKPFYHLAVKNELPLRAKIYSSTTVLKLSLKKMMAFALGIKRW
jgi:hypothetical protein